MTAVADPIAAWHAYVQSDDPSLLNVLLDDDVVFESPVVYAPQIGKAITTGYLRAATKVLGNSTFRYLNEWRAERSTVLEFACEIEGIALNGVDIITWNTAGRITHFKVMVRPLKAINFLHQKMGALLANPS